MTAAGIPAPENQQELLSCGRLTLQEHMWRMVLPYIQFSLQNQYLPWYSYSVVSSGRAIRKCKGRL